MGFSMYIPQKHRYCTDTQKEQKNLYYIPVVTSGIFHGISSCWSPTIPPQNFFEHLIFCWLPTLKADQEVTTWPCRLSSWAGFTEGFRSTDGKVFKANQRIQRSKCTPESSSLLSGSDSRLQIKFSQDAAQLRKLCLLLHVLTLKNL